MQPPFSYRIKKQQLWLSPDRCIFWEEERSLIVSDLHFGKTGHFRKAGIAVPQSVYQEDLQRLLSQVQYFQPRQLLVVGDLFHSRENKELSLFRRWRDDFPDLGIRLIQGNHDILRDGWYEEAGIAVSRGCLELGVFAFVHDITDIGDMSACGATGPVYYFSGHIHPGIRIRGMGKQALQFPCFYFGEEYAVLPAFSRFTGTVSIDPAPRSNIFAILPGAQRVSAYTGRDAGSGTGDGDPGGRGGRIGDGLGGVVDGDTGGRGGRRWGSPAGSPGSIFQIQ